MDVDVEASEQTEGVRQSQFTAIPPVFTYLDVERYPVTGCQAPVIVQLLFHVKCYCSWSISLISAYIICGIEYYIDLPYNSVFSCLENYLLLSRMTPLSKCTRAIYMLWACIGSIRPDLKPISPFLKVPRIDRVVIGKILLNNVTIDMIAGLI